MFIQIIGIGLVILLVILIGVEFYKIKFLKDLKNLKQPSIIYNIDEAEKAKQFLDKIIKDKFEYYLVTEILPIYKVGKQLDKNQVEELKEQFFIDVSLFLNKNTKNLLKKYFNTDAIKIYIIEKFYILLNKVDIAYFEENKVSEKEIKSLLS